MIAYAKDNFMVSPLEVSEVSGLDGGLGFAVLLVVIEESKMITSQLLGVDLK